MAKGYRDERRDADRAKMRADKVARQKYKKILQENQFKDFMGNLRTTDATPKRGTGYVTPTSEFQDAQANKPKPPTQDTLF